MKLKPSQLRELRSGRRLRLFTRDHPGYEVGLNRKVTNVEERVVVVEVSAMPAHELTADDAHISGYAGRGELFESLGFRPEGPAPRFGLEIWVTVLERDLSERPEFMHRDSSHAYTQTHHLALDPDAEVVPRVWLERFASSAAADIQLRGVLRQAENEARPLSERVRMLESAQSAGVDVSRQLAAIRGRVEAAERAVRRKAA